MEVKKIPLLMLEISRYVVSLIIGGRVKLMETASEWTEHTTKKNIELLQTVQNFAAQIVSGTRKFDNVTPILKQLQWLPIIKQVTCG